MKQTPTYMQSLREELCRRGLQVVIDGPSVRATAAGGGSRGCQISLTVVVECAPDPVAGAELAWWWLWEGAETGRWDRERLGAARDVAAAADTIARVVTIENPQRTHSS